MAQVRKLCREDKQNLRKICLETSLLATDSERDKSFLYLMYNDYYSEYESDNCFVFANDNNEAVGYILCAEDFDAYLKIMKKKYLPEISKLGKKYRTMANGEIFTHKLFKNKYPAHLHIDISPKYQHMGAGSRLIAALKEHLKTKGCKGLMLSVGMSNKKAIAFYKKNGFKIAVNLFGSIIMVCPLNE